MRIVLSLLALSMLGSSYASPKYIPSIDAMEKRDRPQLEEKDVTMPEQRGIQEEESGVDIENEEDIILKESDHTIRHGKPDAKQSKLVPYGIK